MKQSLNKKDAAILMNRIVEETICHLGSAHISEDCNSALDIEAIVKIFDDPTKIELKISLTRDLEKIKL